MSDFHLAQKTYLLSAKKLQRKIKFYVKRRRRRYLSPSDDKSPALDEFILL
jgi:hypothetical protein